MNDSLSVVPGWRDESRPERWSDLGSSPPDLTSKAARSPSPTSGQDAGDQSGCGRLIGQVGSDFVKVHSRLSRGCLLRGRRGGKETRVGFRRARAGLSDDRRGLRCRGQRSLEHTYGIPSICSAEEREALKPAHPIQRFLGSCAESDPTPDFRRLAANGTWVVPTLTVTYAVSQLPDTILPNDSTNRYRSAALRRLRR